MSFTFYAFNEDLIQGFWFIYTTFGYYSQDYNSLPDTFTNKMYSLYLLESKFRILKAKYTSLFLNLLYNAAR